MQRGRNLQLAILSATLAVAGWSAQVAQAAPPAVDAKGLPAGWDAQPLGDDTTLVEKQSVSVDNGTWTIVADGKDLWNDTDGGLIVYTKHSGNGSVSFHLISQKDGQNGDGSWVKTAAGFRESLDPQARDVHISATSGNMCEPAVRVNAAETPRHPSEQTGSNGVGFWGAGGGARPDCGRPIGNGIWIGVDRNGDTFNYFTSEDGKLWTQQATTTQVGFPADTLAGIEATAHKDDPTDNSIKSQTSVMDNVNVSNDLLTPHAITGVAYTPMDKAALVTWNPVSDADATYSVYQYSAPDISDAKLVKAGIKESSLLVDGLTNGTSYKFAVTATLPGGVESAKQVPMPTMGNNNGASDNTGVVVPNAPIAALGGLVLYNIGTDAAGSVSLTSGTDLASAAIHLKGSGFDIWEAGDGFAFLAMPMEGDLDVSANFVKGPTEDDDGGGWELGGPMFRESLDTGSRFVLAQIAATNQLQFKRRLAPNNTPTNTGLDRSDNTARPVDMRLVRKGDDFQAYYSEDAGKTWKDLGDPSSTDAGATSKQTITGFAKKPYVGIALSGHTEGEYSEADIDHIVIKPAQ